MIHESNMIMMILVMYDHLNMTKLSVEDAPASHMEQMFYMWNFFVWF